MLACGQGTTSAAGIPRVCSTAQQKGKPVKKFLLALMLLAIHADPASAARSRFELEGEIKVQFYYDQSFYSTGFWNYSNLQTDLLNALNYTGTYWLGLKFVQDTSNFNFLVDMGSRQTWSRNQVRDWLQANLPITTGIVKVLIHSRGMTFDGICYDDIPGSGFSSYDQGLTFRALPAGGQASSHLMVTAKAGCSVNSSALISQASLKQTFVHEIGHALAHPGADNRMAQCKTPPQASVMCHSVAGGAVRSWQRWFVPDITLIRTEVFDTSSRQYPIVQCYEYSSYQACDTECVNTAGFPSPGATEVYENCKRNYCDRMCR
jgi:hypothetical protein